MTLRQSILQRRADTAFSIAIKTLQQIADMPHAGKKGALALSTLAFLHTQAPELVPVFPIKPKGRVKTLTK